MRLARVLATVVGVVVALGAIAVDAPQVLAVGDQFQDSAVSTYELQPARGVVHVTMQITMANKKAGSSRSYKCTGWAWDPYYGYYYAYETTCTTRTSWYYYSTGHNVEKDAKNFKAKANSGTVSVKPGKTTGDWRLVTLKFSPLYYGKTRQITFQYDLPVGGPRSEADRRGGYAYARFCAPGPGTDKGEVRVVVPEGFELSLTRSMTSKVANGKRVYTSGKLASSPWKFFSCVEGMDKTGGYERTSIPGRGGAAAVEAWKGDTTWSDVVSAVVREDLPKLEAVLGPRPGGADLTIHEGLARTSQGNPYDEDTGVLTLSEATVDRAAVTDALASTWFPRTRFRFGWVPAGTIRWAEREAGLSDAPCGKPADGIYDLVSWIPPSAAAIQAEKDRFALKEQIACWIVSETARAMGPAGTTAAMTTLLGGLDPWSASGTPAPRDGEPIDWQGWLDIVTERGLIPAGADPAVAADLVVAYGGTLDDKDVIAHEQAREGWHALQDLTDGKAPAPVLAALSAWDDGTAQAAIDAATRAWTAAAAVEATLPAVHTDGGAVQQAVIAATTQDDLDAAVALGDRQVAAAEDVADALGVLEAPRDTLQALGLLGTTLPDPAVAIAAVEQVDAAGAADAANAIRSTIGGARDAGTQRAALGGGGAVVLVLLVVVGIVVTRRRRRTAVVAVGLVAAAPPVDAAVVPAPPPVDPPAPPPSG